eukprot:10966435-Lingulodinium_polyedra.AAC.1
MRPRGLGAGCPADRPAEEPVDTAEDGRGRSPEKRPGRPNPICGLSRGRPWRCFRHRGGRRRARVA